MADTRKMMMMRVVQSSLASSCIWSTRRNLKVIQDALHCCLLACCVETDKDSIAALLKAMEGKNIEEVIAAGSKKLASFGAAGAAPAAAGGAGAAGGGAPAAKVVEKVVEEEEEIDMGGGMDMFGGEEDY
ncbi:unnamed protein product [Peronospora belbahrii]|uniref:60S acidic ribosomal protein P2 n=1 Tax=Peronospora belbahrii TaxID=622444 RepID=A0ABN8CP09_9STRA|nr:unnamed protein product [Peronospora belbahrii]